MATSQYLDADAALAEGRKAYADKRHRRALECFTRVMKRCPCARGIKRERCRCKNFEAVAGKRESIFREAMYTCSCTIGKTFNKCDASNHIRALDYRAATFEAMGEIDRAKLDAEWLLELAPRLPEGYLRLGKVARLQKKHEYAWQIYNAGIEATESQPRSPLVEKLYQARKPLAQRFARRDPLSLPMEIIQMIWSSMDYLTLTRCARVCKTWRGILSTGQNKVLWKTLHFDKTRRKVSLQALSYLLKNCDNDAKGLIVDDCRRLGLTYDKWKAILPALHNVERLELRRPLEKLPMLVQGAGKNPARSLRHVVLEDFHGEFDEDNLTLRSILQYADKLEYMDLLNCDSYFPQALTKDSGGVHENLTHLRFSASPPPSIHMAVLHRFAPNLKQLWLEGSLTSFPNFESTEPVWPLLEAFVFVHRDGVREAPRSSYPTISSLLHKSSSSHVQHLDLTMKKSQWETLTNFQLPFLRTVRFKQFTVSGREANHCFGPSLRDEKLQTFTIQFPEMELSQAWGEASSAHLSEYDWLKGSLSIRTLFLRGFGFRRWDDPVTGQLPTFLASLPNLEELVLQETIYEDAELCLLIEGITKACKNLKTIWQDQIKGVLMDKLVELGKREGVDIWSGEPPRQWPIALEADD